MNHNNVISLPVKPNTALVAGDIVKLDTNGHVVKGTAATMISGNIGVILHDVSEPASGGPSLPAAVHLFSAGGIFNVNVLTAAGQADIGVPHICGAGGLALAKGTPATGSLCFVPLEKTTTGGMIQAIFVGS